MLELVNISKNYGRFCLSNIYLHVKQGEYLVLLGDSGSGKTLLLEIIAGLSKADKGKIFLNNKKITKTKIQKRKIGVVFEDLAIFPHLSVRENIAYPIKGTKQKTRAKVAEIAGLIGIAHLLGNMPNELSKGELQRLAFARTLAGEPEILLLDQPLSHLDTCLKGEMRKLLRHLHKQGHTIIHVTQEYEEAITLANKVAIMYKGQIVQSGETNIVFSTPCSQFVAKFIGINNYYPAQIIENRITEQKIAVISDNFEININTEEEGFGFIYIKDDCILLSEMKQQSYMRNNFQGTVIEIIKSKTGAEVILDIGLQIRARLNQRISHALDLNEGKTTWVSFRTDDVVFVKKQQLLT